MQVKIMPLANFFISFEKISFIGYNKKSGYRSLQIFFAKPSEQVLNTFFPANVQNLYCGLLLK
ncbi:MAG: hypothetical protein ACFFD1_02610 [Candidatus Thorarchaeota archaeon]